MPRKKVITRKVRRLTPREIDYIVSAVSLYDCEMDGQTENTEHFYVDLVTRLQGEYKNLAIIVEE
tara:strand:+ start:953 stop:1147 length:195 start_codon:yes stop_codon:yes gene_type:complete